MIQRSLSCVGADDRRREGQVRLSRPRWRRRRASNPNVNVVYIHMYQRRYAFKGGLGDYLKGRARSTVARLKDAWSDERARVASVNGWSFRA